MPSMPDLMAPQVVAAAGPILIDTFLKHYLSPRKKREDSEGKDTARVDLMYDEAFSVMKTFLNIATQYPVASLQRAGQLYTPSPPWVAVHRLRIPHPSLKEAADYLVTALGGEDMAYRIAGGTVWWQARAGPGVEAEWITMKRDDREHVNTENVWAKENPDDPEAVDVGFVPEMDKRRCMLYIHGGAYYWGSINTHRYSIWRYARKIKGRCFAVNYRKAPQYPFPCAIQDCLAAYLYLVRPPPGAPHRPVDPKRIIVAGDSAGGGLVWALLQILRDTPGLELPAGGVLISPWSDLTHSFPSITQNTSTDVVPRYSFIHKPSSLWPPPPPDLTEEVQSHIVERVKDAVNKFKTTHHVPAESINVRTDLNSPLVSQSSNLDSIHTSDPEAHGKLKALFKKRAEGVKPDSHSPAAMVNPASAFKSLASSKDGKDGRSGRAASLTQVADPFNMTVLGENVTIDTQIQLYATNTQLNHPWVSPVLGYLGGLPPVYVLAGDDEVLRDEIIYAAHKAANPAKYPVREDVKELLPSLKGIEGKHGPTDVHLQVYDGAGHDLPLFSMTRPSRGAYRAIAAFCRYVTPNHHFAPAAKSANSSVLLTPSISDGSPKLTASPFTESPPITRSTTFVDKPASAKPSPLSSVDKTEELDSRVEMLKLDTNVSADPSPVASPMAMTPGRITPVATPSSDPSSATTPTSVPPSMAPRPQPKRQGTASSISSLFKRPVHAATAPPLGQDAKHHHGAHHQHTRHASDVDQESKAKPGEAGYMGIYAGSAPFTDHMIRERVDFNGVCRPLEPVDQLGAFKMPADEIGMIKEAPAMRYIEGQALWDHKFRRARKTIARHRKRNLKHAAESDPTRVLHRWETAMNVAKVQRKSQKGGASSTTRASLTLSTGDTPVRSRAASTASGVSSSGSTASATTEGGVEPDDSDAAFTDGWGAWQWALGDEAPPPSAIVSRRDLPEGRQLALLADRVETGTSGSGKSNPLSIWVLMATFMSSSAAERRKAREAVQGAKEIREQEAREKKERREKGHEAGKGKGRSMGERLGSMFGRRKEGGVSGGGAVETATGKGKERERETVREVEKEEEVENGKAKVVETVAVEEAPKEKVDEDEPEVADEAGETGTTKQE